MKIQNGYVYTPDFRFEKKTLTINSAAGTFESAARDEEILDASGCYVIPGLIDIHFHGCMGADVCDGTLQSLETIAAYEAQEGVTSVCPATLTLPEEELLEILACAAAFASGERDAGRADLIGLNMEGPFISRSKKGAQNGRYIRPCSADLCRSFVKASGGLVKIIGLAPEENPGFEEYIAEVKDSVRVSLAHTDADYDMAMAAFAAGASHAVHLFNAMSGLSHRAPGVVGAVRDCRNVTAELICDGNHVHPAAVRAAFDMLGDERIVLISDSLRACGLGDGKMMLGGQEVEVHGTRATLTDSGSLAGSVCSLMRCLQTAVLEMHIPLESAVRCATLNPARVIGAQETVGSIEEGKRANAVLLDERDLHVCAVIKDGIRIR